jgi:hypothetical protein
MKKKVKVNQNQKKIVAKKITVVARTNRARQMKKNEESSSEE